MKPISCKDTGLLILVFGSRQDAHRRWWHTGTVVQKVNLLDEVEGIWRAPTRILSYLYTNIIYIKYNIKIAIFFFLSEVIPDTFQSLTHCRQCVSRKLHANAILFTPLCITSPFLHKYNPPVNRLLPFCQSHSATFLLQNLQHHSIHCHAIYQDVANKSIVMSWAEAKGWLRKRQRPDPLTKTQGQLSNWFSNRGSCRPVKHKFFSHYLWTKHLHTCTQSGPSSTHLLFKFAWFTSGILQMCAVFSQFLRISPSSIFSLLAGSSVIEWPLSEATRSFLIKAYISIVLFQQPRYPII